MKKSVLVCVIAVLALALMGFGFAKWSDSVAINGTVNTGDVNITIAPGDPAVNDPGADPQYGPGHNEEGKDVASITNVQGTSEKEIKVTISNGYPYYQPGFTFVITSTGSIPVKIENITASNWSGNLVPFIKLASWSYTVTNPASNGLPAVNQTVESDDQNATWDGLADAIRNIQLHQNGTLKVTVDLYIDETVNGELCPENGSATGTITIESAQWNEVGAPPAM